MSTAARRAPAPLALMAVIFWLSAQSDAGGGLPEAARIVGHAAEFGLLAALWAWALVPWLGRRALLAAAVIAGLYAVSDELHQSYVPGRDADPLDVLVDVIGVLVALAIIRHVWRLGRSSAS